MKNSIHKKLFDVALAGFFVQQRSVGVNLVSQRQLCVTRGGKLLAVVHQLVLQRRQLLLEIDNRSLGLRSVQVVLLLQRLVRSHQTFVLRRKTEIATCTAT